MQSLFLVEFFEEVLIVNQNLQIQCKEKIVIMQMPQLKSVYPRQIQNTRN
jgi:hypothetical protein